jgi:hypothetical protein
MFAIIQHAVPMQKDTLCIINPEALYQVAGKK